MPCHDHQSTRSRLVQNTGDSGIPLITIAAAGKEPAHRVAYKSHLTHEPPSTDSLHVGETKPIRLPRIERSSPSIGIKPPAGAVVLFDGSTADTWERGVMEGGLLKANHSTSKSRFKSYTAAPITTPLRNEPAPVFLQDHKNPVYFRNIWVLPR